MWAAPERLPSVADLVERVSAHVFGLDIPVKRLCTAVHQHLTRAFYDRDDPPANLVLIGPTGMGKTWTVRQALEASGLPYIEANATQFSEVGYRGRDLAWMFSDVVVKYRGAGYQLHDCVRDFERWGVVVLDEFDKWRTVPNPKQRQPGLTLQAELLKMLEGDLVTVMRYVDDRQPFTLHTGRILFIALGAFEGLDRQMEGHLDGHLFPNLYMKAEPADLMEYGFLQELVGRFPVILPLPPLRAEHLAAVLEHTVWARYHRAAADLGVELVAAPDALTEVAQRALSKSIGARALPALLDGYLWRAWAEARPGDRIVLDVAGIQSHSASGGGARVEPTLRVLTA